VNITKPDADRAAMVRLEKSFRKEPLSKDDKRKNAGKKKQFPDW